MQLLSREFMTFEKERMRGKSWRWAGGTPSFAASIEPGKWSADRRTYFMQRLLPRDASAERGDATVSRLSVRLSVTFRYRDHIRWNSLKIISRPNSLGSMCWLKPNIGDLVQREHPQN